MQVPLEPPAAEQVVDFTGGVAESVAFQNITTFIRLHTDTACSVLIGTNPTATTSSNVAAAVDANNLLKVDVEAIAAATLAAQALAQSTQSICWGTCSGGTTTTAIVSTLNNPASITDSSELNGRVIIFLGNTATGGLKAQAGTISGSTTGATPTITIASALTRAPANGDTFVVL